MTAERFAERILPKILDKKMKTLAAILTQTGKPLELDEIDIPQLRSGQVLVEISHSGICGTQLNEVDRKKGEKMASPLYWT